MATKKSIFSSVIVISVATMMLFITTFASSSAQTNNGNATTTATSSSNMTKNNMELIMSELAKIHLMAANDALMKGNTTAAFSQMNLAYLQLAMQGMKDMGTLNETQAMKFMQGAMKGPSSSSDNKIMVPDNCIIIQGGVLACRDILTGSYSLAK